MNVQRMRQGFWPMVCNIPPTNGIPHSQSPVFMFTDMCMDAYVIYSFDVKTVCWTAPIIHLKCRMATVMPGCCPRLEVKIIQWQL